MNDHAHKWEPEKGCLVAIKADDGRDGWELCKFVEMDDALYKCVECNDDPDDPRMGFVWGDLCEPAKNHFNFGVEKMSDTLDKLKRLLRCDICEWCEAKYKDDVFACMEHRRENPDACEMAKEARAEDIYKRFIEPLEGK
jgi:hypothetical protein